MTQVRGDPVKLPFPGRRTKLAVRFSKACFLIFLVVLSFIAGLPIWNANALLEETESADESPSSDDFKTQPPPTVGAEPVPDLSLPRTVISDVEKLMGAGGVIQSSGDNLTLYNSVISIRLYGGLVPHDELLGPRGKTLSSLSFWSVQADIGGVWVPLLPVSNSFNIIGTTELGTLVARDMQVASGSSSGLFRITYKATATGPLKWDLEFTANSAGRYRLVYSWLNVTEVSELKPSEKQFTVSYPDGNYTLKWDDIPVNLNTTSQAVPGKFSLFVELGSVPSGSRVLVDPSIVAYGVPESATAYTFQRKVFYEPKGGRYWVFYYNGTGMTYRSSADGTLWSSPGTFPPGLHTNSNNGDPAEIYLTHIYNSGQTVVAATGEKTATTSTATVSARYSIGTISGSTLTWGTVQPAVSITRTCSTGTCNLGIRHVSVTASSDGNLAFSYNWFTSGSGSGLCSGGKVSSESGVYVTYRGTPHQVACNSGSGSYDTEQYRSIILPSNSQGQVRVIYQFKSGSNVQLLSNRVDASGALGPSDILDGRVMDTTEFSAVSDSDYRIHVLYRGTDGNVTYTYRSPSASEWGPPSKDIFAGSRTHPTITADYSTNDVYAFAIHGSSVAMKTKSLNGAWSDRTVAYPVTNRSVPTNLGSNAASASATNSSKVLIVWTEGVGSFNATFASIPIKIVWSPYSAPPDPWDGTGLAPYGQYFANLGEYVSPSTGVLTIRQTDLSVPGRGLDFAVTRVYSEPYSFLGAGPHLYESYPWAPLGNGWQLNYPWLSNVQSPSFPSYLHLWDGQGYRIPYNFWTGTTSTFENHYGEHFSLVRNSSGIYLYVKSGISYTFDATYKLRSIIDTTGNNTITFRYNTSNRIANVTDTVGRVFQFCYTGNLLQTIYQTSSPCASPGSARSVSFGYSSQSLTSVTDPGGRVTTYQYNAVSDTDVAPWLISQIVYPTQWFTNYSYVPMTTGAGATTYRIIRQITYSTTPAVKRLFYSYSQGSGDEVTNSTVVTYGGPGGYQLISRTRYAFSFLGMTMNISDAYNRLVRGVHQRFGVSGEVPREIVLVTALNMWYWTKTSPGSGWNSQSSWLLDSSWNIAPAVANYSRPYPPWGPISGWLDTDARWIWWNPDAATSSTDEPVWFRTTFHIAKTTSAMIEVTADNTYTLYLDGENLRTDGTWQNRETINRTLTPGDHVIGVSADNTGAGNPAGLLLSIRNNANGEVLLRTDTSIGTYSNYYRHDLWGNRIYSRRPINPSANWYHESFTAVFNNGHPLGFYVFTETFSQDNMTRTDSSWAATGTGLWKVEDGEYSLTGSRGNETKVELSHRDAVFETKVRWLSGPHFEGYIAFRYQENGNHYRVYLSDYDDKLRFDKVTSGQVTTLNSFTIAPVLNQEYTIRVESSGSCHHVYLDGSWKFQACDSTMLEGKYLALGTFASSSSTGTHIHFDNVQVRPLPNIFSNSFFPNTLNANIHDRPAGTARLQNGTGTLPLESYYGYLYWGGLSQTKQRYDPAPGTSQWLTLSNTYDAFGNLKVATDARGNSTSYAYDPSFQSAYLTNQTSLDGPTRITTLYAYNFTTGNILSITDPKNNVTTYQNDNLGRVKRINYPLAAYVQYAYNDQANYVDVTNENGWKTRQIYDGLGRQTITDGFLDGMSYSNETLTYKWHNQIASVTDPLGRVISYQYDALGRLVTVTKPDGNITRSFYNDLASWIRSVDEDGNSRCNVYDRLGRLISVIERASASCSALSMNGLYYITNHYYNEVGNLVRTTNSDTNYLANHGFETGTFNSWTVTGDAIIRSDNVRSGMYSTGPEYDPELGKYLAFTLQQNIPGSVPAKRLTTLQLWYRYGSSSAADSVRVLYTDGTYTSTTLPSVSSWTLKNLNYDTSKQISGIKVIRTAYQTNNIILDDFVFRISHSTNHSYDNLGRLTLATYSDGKNESYLYDNNGNVVRKIDRKNVKTLYSYDSLDRVKTVTFCGTPITSNSYTYDKNSNLLTLQNQNATITYAYDARDRVLSERYEVNVGTRQVVDLGCSGSGGTWTVTGGVSKTYTVTFSYNGELLETITYPTLTITNIAVKYSYDGLGRILNMTKSGTSTYYARSFTYYKDDQLKGFQFGNGLIGNYTYGPLSRPASIILKNNSTTILSMSYLYNKTGTVASITGQVNSATVNEQYRYDPLQRLTNATVTSQGATTPLWYEYDEVGNRLRQSQNSIITTYNYTYSNNRLTNSTSTTSPNTRVSYSYDANGNLKAQNVTTTATTRWTYTWDAANRLLNVKKNDANQGVHAYDGLGRLVESIEASTTMFFAYHGTETLFKDISGLYSIDYLYASGQKIATVDSSSGSYNTVRYFHTDHLGSTRLVTDSSGTVQFADGYQPFGQGNGTPVGSETYRFTGKPWSSNTELYYFYQRWYDPSVGRFISLDPVPGQLSDSQSLNGYVYVRNSPTVLTDPSGLCYRHPSPLHCELSEGAILLACLMICMEGLFLMTNMYRLWPSNRCIWCAITLPRGGGTPEIPRTIITPGVPGTVPIVNPTVETGSPGIGASFGVSTLIAGMIEPNSQGDSVPLPQDPSARLEALRSSNPSSRCQRAIAGAALLGLVGGLTASFSTWAIHLGGETDGPLGRRIQLAGWIGVGLGHGMVAGGLGYAIWACS